MGILFGPDDFRIVSLKAFVVVVVGLGVFVFVAGGALPAILETVYGFINAVQAQKGG
jgi:hypothetical protein